MVRPLAARGSGCLEADGQGERMARALRTVEALARDSEGGARLLSALRRLAAASQAAVRSDWRASLESIGEFLRYMREAGGGEDNAECEFSGCHGSPLGGGRWQFSFRSLPYIQKGLGPQKKNKQNNRGFG